MNPDKIEIAGLGIDNVSYSDLLHTVAGSVTANKKTIITYVNAHTINLIYRDKSLIELLNSFDIIHPDGVGIYAASKFLYGKNGFKERITGSDLYPMLIDTSIKNNYKLFFFGHDEDTLNKIRLNYPALNICGTVEGYEYNDNNVVSAINDSMPDILIIGLSFPKQEKWLITHKDKLNFKVGICVGDGIKVFAGIKRRGPKFLQTLGLEWTARLLLNPVKYFSRYVIGNPLFLYRIIMLKIRKFMR
jgi:exopolysaccharide biosynthesis WecB/TagA/CpsF family protein